MVDKYLYGSEEHVITDAEKKRYQESKKLKRTKIVLTEEQIIKFAELVAKNAPYGDFEKYFNIGVRDVENQKIKLGLMEMEDARNFLKALSKKNVKKETVVEEPKTEVKTETEVKLKYENINDYKKKENRRFRMTKDQKSRGLTREQAFQETYGS